MKKVLCGSLTLLSFMLICVSLFTSRGSQEFSVANASEQPEGTFFVANFETGNNVTSFTPMDEFNNRLAGSSWVPKHQDRGSGVKVLNDEINVSGFFDEFDVKNETQDKLALQAWLYFDLNTMTDLTLGFRSEDGSKRVEWYIDELELYSLLEKDFTDYKYDLIFYSDSTVPWGWNLLTLPFSSATTITDGLIIDGGGTSGNFLDLTYFYVRQNDESVLPLGLNVYTLTINSTTKNNISCDEKQAFCVVEFNELAGLNETLYIGEYYTLPSINSVFKTLWIGNANLLSQNYRNEQYYKVEIASNGTKSNEYYGKAMLLENREYDICFMVGRGNGKYVTLKKQTLAVQSYGSGVWFIDDEEEIKVGEVSELKYDVHQVFSNAVIAFSSSDEEVLEIVSVDLIKQVVKVRGLKKGEATITIKIYDDRLLNSVSEDGIENTNFVVSVSNESNKIPTVKIMLWIAFGLILTFAIYYSVVTIRKYRNIDVK